MPGKNRRIRYANCEVRGAWKRDVSVIYCSREVKEINSFSKNFNHLEVKNFLLHTKHWSGQMEQTQILSSDLMLRKSSQKILKRKQLVSCLSSSS